MGKGTEMQQQNRRNKGFTLVEVIVVLVILAILAAIMIPAMTGWIDKTRQKRLVVACRTCVTAAQTLASEQYGKFGADGINVQPSEIMELAKIKGTVSAIDIDKPVATVEHLLYTDAASGENVLYCRTATCHAEHYTFGAGIANDGNDWSQRIQAAAQNALNRNVNVDSNAPTDITANNYGNWTKSTLAALMNQLGGKDAATALATANIQSWAVRVYTDKNNGNKVSKDILMSDQNIDNAKGELVRAIRYDTVEQKYYVGYAKVGSSSVTDTESVKYTYNTLGSVGTAVEKYFTELAVCTDYNDALAQFATMSVKPTNP